MKDHLFTRRVRMTPRPMSLRFVVSFVLATLTPLAAVPGCSSGSTSGGSDAGATGSDAATGSACLPGGSTSAAGGGSCDQSKVWGCGKDGYEIRCACPSGKCTCLKNNVTVTVVAYPYSCSDPSNCDATLVPQGGCGFPTP
jgi:hypothetical protein